MSRPAKTEKKPDTGRVGYDPTLTGLSRGAPVMVYDGACNLCHGWVRFALKRDRKERLRFLAAQSPRGQEFLKRNRLPAENFESFYLVENAVILHKSRGFLSMAQYLRWPWPWLALLSILPTRLLDRLYDLIAQNRYRWFGRRELCLIADQAKAARFL
jgi:predicted DCC family thiol-disulfide oxidoreductase YuxK